MTNSGLLARGFLSYLFWDYSKKTTNKAAIVGAFATMIALYFKAVPKGWTTSPFFVDVPFMDQMGYTAVLTMIIIAIVSLLQNKGKDDK
jgi:SSS family solute:Na+ symporter